MRRQTKDEHGTAIVAEGLRELFGRWSKEEAEELYDDEPSWEEVKKALDEERERAGDARKLFPEG